MARVKRGNVAKKKRATIFALTKGFRGAPNRLAAIAERAWYNAGRSAYRDRRRKRRDMRKLWIVRINAAVRELGLRYGEFINLLNKANITLDRKQLSEMAFNEPEVFAKLVEKVKSLAPAA